MHFVSISIVCCLLLPSVHFIVRTEGQDLTTSVSFTRVSVSELTWNLPRPVLSYHSYMDVYPTRYDVPTGLTRITWAFQTLMHANRCGNFTVHFLVQQGGLPLVNQSSLSFPDNYFVPSSSLIHFELKLGHMVSFALIRPMPGPWYVIAYTNEEVDQRIRQKGFHKKSSDCTVNYMSNLQLGPPLSVQRLSLLEAHSIAVTSGGTLISFSLPISAYGFRISITRCYPFNCSLTLKYQPFIIEKEHSQNCSDVDVSPCHFHVPSPSLGDDQLVTLTATSHLALEVNLQIFHMSCKKYMTSSPTPCVEQYPLTRISTINPGFSSLGYVYLSPASLHITFGWTRTIIIPFHIQQPNDIGHTLGWWMHIASFGRELSLLEKDLEVRVCGGLVYNHLPDLQDDTFDVCQNLTKAVQVSLVGGSSRNESIVYVPYPRVGVWHIVLQATCFTVDNGSQVSCPLQTSVDMSVNIQRCIHNGCGGKGDCLLRTVGSEIITYSACKCDADYRGYGCQDDSHALPSSLQLTGAFLLTLSNMLFLPAIIISTKRRFYVEAFVYFYTMVFSTFYHACDGDRIDEYRLCLISFNVLQSADFFGSSCSVWITLIAMAAIRIPYLTPLLQMMGPFGLFIGVVYDKTSLWVIAVPIAAGLVVLFISWGIKMYKRKKLYPSKRRYLFFLMPGITLATVAAVIYSFLETESNYKYLHSMWHICIALSICFLLPPHNGQGSDDSKLDVSMTTPLTHIMTEDNHNHRNSNGRASHDDSQCDSNADSPNDADSVTGTDVTSSPQQH